jgi:nitronate monooxygenase
MQCKSLLWRPLHWVLKASKLVRLSLLAQVQGANTTQREALLSKDTTRTELTDKFTGRLARGIKNHLMDELNDIDSTVMPFPLQHALVQTVAQPASMRGQADLMTLWAGQSVGLCHDADAAELMTELIVALEGIRKAEFEELGKQSQTASR